MGSLSSIRIYEENDLVRPHGHAMRAIKSDSEAPASTFASQFTLTLPAVKPAYVASCDSFRR